MLLYGFWWEPDSLRLHEYDIALDVPALKGLSIAVIADLHAGAPYIDAAKIDRVVAATNAARPDLILLAGDYVSDRADGSLRLPLDVIAEHLKGLDAPLGVYAVLGNHDMTVGRRRVTAALGRAGILTLRDAHVAIGRAAGTVVIAGFGDPPRLFDETGRKVRGEKLLRRRFEQAQPFGEVFRLDHSRLLLVDPHMGGDRPPLVAAGRQHHRRPEIAHHLQMWRPIRTDHLFEDGSQRRMLADPGIEGRDQIFDLALGRERGGRVHDPR